jgi:fatty acid-binding protein DegV
MPTRVVTDSVASIPAAQAKSAGIDVVSLFVNDGERHEADSDIDLPSFYKRLADMRQLPTSSQPSVESLVTVFERAIGEGSDAIGVFISSKMSGTVDTARMAADMVLKRSPGRRIEIVDSGSNSMEEGFAALSAAGSPVPVATSSSADAAVARLAGRATCSHRVLEYLRVEAYQARIRVARPASAIRPISLRARPDRLIREGAHHRTRAAESRGLCRGVKARGLRRVVVHYIGDQEPARRFATEAIEPIAQAAVDVIPVSAVIGLHVGPAVGIVYETELEPTPVTTSARRLLPDAS